MRASRMIGCLGWALFRSWQSLKFNLRAACCRRPSAARKKKEAAIQALGKLNVSAPLPGYESHTEPDLREERCQAGQVGYMHKGKAEEQALERSNPDDDTRTE